MRFWSEPHRSPYHSMNAAHRCILGAGLRVDTKSIRRRSDRSGQRHRRGYSDLALVDQLLGFGALEAALFERGLPVLLGRPGLLIPPCLKIGLSPVRRQHVPRGLKFSAGLVKRGGRAARAFALMRAGKEPACPSPQVFVMWDAVRTAIVPACTSP